MCCAQIAENTGRKNRKKIRHLRAIAQICRVISSQLRHVSTTEKNLLNSNISSTCPHSMVNFGPLTAEIDSGVWGTPANFNGFRVLALLLQRRRSTQVNQTLHDVWPSPALVDYIHYWGLLPPNGILPRAKFTASKSCVYIFSVTARHWSSERQPNFAAWYKEWNYRAFATRHIHQKAPPIFRRAAITLGIGPHSSSFYISREA